MDSLKLGMRQADLDQQRQSVLRVQEPFKLAQGIRHLEWGRRDENRFVERAAAGADPVLAGSQLAGRQRLPAYARQQLGVEFPD